MRGAKSGDSERSAPLGLIPVPLRRLILISIYFNIRPSLPLSPSNSLESKKNTSVAIHQGHYFPSNTIFIGFLFTAGLLYLISCFLITYLRHSMLAQTMVFRLSYEEEESNAFAYQGCLILYILAPVLEWW